MGIILVLYWDNGRNNGKYYNGVREGSGFIAFGWVGCIGGSQPFVPKKVCTSPRSVPEAGRAHSGLGERTLAAFRAVAPLGLGCRV